MAPLFFAFVDQYILHRMSNIPIYVIQCIFLKEVVVAIVYVIL